MTPQEAYSLLEIEKESSDEDLKKHYKELAKKYHPDIYKEEPDKFKKINEAYQLVLDYRANPAKYEPKLNVGHGFWGNVSDLGDIIFNAGDFFKNISGEEEFNHPPVHLNMSLNISFHESILGCNKEISYKRFVKCQPCQGIGFKQVGNGCEKCDGFGRVTIKNKGMIFQSSCNTCYGKGTKKNKCEKCNGKKTPEEQRNGHVNVPPGTHNGEILRLAGEGNFAGRHMFGDSYTDVFISVKVESYKDMVLKDHDVISEIKIPLLEALEGVTKEVETVYGNKEITIKPKSRHSDKIKIPKCGVKNTDGTHIVQLNIEYPDDVSNLIGVLK